MDEVLIKVYSGNGGAGCVSFRRERFVPKGGPDGGDGGRGGDVIFRAVPEKRTLYHLRSNDQFRANNGLRGQGSKKTGKAGKDLVIDVPVGTLIIDYETESVLYDLVSDNTTVVVAEGGRGGRGNSRFRSSTNRVPRFAQPGEPGCMLPIRLELKLIADVGIIGFPNVGKSTLLSVISSARPKIGIYPFTTLVPNLGISSLGGVEPFVVADIPGLIEGAHTGSGLGLRFLRHIERTTVLVHLVDASQITPENPFAGVQVIDQELMLYSKDMSDKLRLFVLNKVDIPLTSKSVEAFKHKCESIGCDVLCISAIKGKGIRSLVLKLAKMLGDLSEPKRVY